MKLSDARENYYTFSASLSKADRQLCFAGIAVIWLFVVKDSDIKYTIPRELLIPLGCFIAGLSFDLLHYIVATASWGIYQRQKEKKVKDDEEFKYPRWINWMPLFFFWVKTIATLAGYVILFYELVKISG